MCPKVKSRKLHMWTSFLSHHLLLKSSRGAEHLRTSDSDNAAATFAEQFSEQVLTPTPSLVLTPSHDDPLLLQDLRPSEAGIVLERHIHEHMQTHYSFGNPQMRWEVECTLNSSIVIIQVEAEMLSLSHGSKTSSSRKPRRFRVVR